MIEGGQINGSGGGVTSLNLLTGALALIAGTSITLDVGSDSITINATGVAAGVASFNARTGIVTSQSGDYAFSQISGTLGIPQGGTGQTTANAALNALLPSQTGNINHVFTTDGTNTSWAALGTLGVTSFNGRSGDVLPTTNDYSFSQISGINTVVKGGTGISLFNHGDMMVASGNTTLTTLPAVAIGQVLISNGVGQPPIYSPDPSVGSISLYNLTGQIVFGTTNTITLTMPALTSDWFFTLPDANSNSVRPRTLTAGSAVQFIDNTGLQNLMVVINQVLTSFSAAAGTVTNTDTIVTFANKVVGNIALLTPSVQQIVANHLMLVTDNIIEVEANNLTITLLDATIVEEGKIYYVNNGNVIGTSVIPQGGQFINDTLTTWSINVPYNGTGYYSNGTGWRTI